MTRYLVLVLALSLAACETAEGLNGLLTRQAPATPPIVSTIISTEDMAPRIGCTHIARLLADQNAPMTEVLRRLPDCPPEGTPGWVVVRDEPAFRNYEDIGRGVRGLPRPAA